ncbi:LrgA [Bacillus coahuilensis p1.1.43]|uniref:LrgA n=1 Tax=Bacillus coahuilensis p1.1.43 TaxID=1150625 RepID=A0A147K8U8_9BACI|nr:CidA/LrgA family protein [Bacillus coahuilensis]KUP06743.1 LrgA [Bacillus coahuilensis p1.1.43]
MKKILLVLIQLLILCFIFEMGTWITYSYHLAIPGNVVGLVILFMLLWSGIVKLHWIEEASRLLLKHLAFFFVPISVGLITLGHIIQSKGIILFLIITISTIMGLVVTGITSQKMIIKKDLKTNE